MGRSPPSGTSSPGRLARAALVAVATIVAGPGPALATSGLDGGGPALIGDERPALEVATLDGGIVNAGRMAGKIVIVDFFATWCGPCHQALPDLLAARAGAAPDALLVLVDLQESPEAVRAWTARANLPPEVVVALDPIGAAYRRWGARKLPTTFLVDQAGVVRHINRGWGPAYRARLEKWLHGMASPAHQDPKARIP